MDKDFKDLIQELIDDGTIAIDKSKIILLNHILRGVYFEGKSDYQDEVRTKFKEKATKLFEKLIEEI